MGPDALRRGTTRDVVMCFVGVLRIDDEGSIQQCRAVLEVVGQLPGSAFLVPFFLLMSREGALCVSGIVAMFLRVYYLAF